MSQPRLDQPFVIGSVDTPIGRIPQVSAELSTMDRRGAYQVRWNIGRMNYTVDSGLYALGDPDENSSVLVSCNYKLSFDKLRQELPLSDFWILVLETNGINVWCAAGKGTFGTDELVGRIKSSELEKVVSHRELILPQLSAPGVAAHQVKKRSGFKVIYGPIRSVDLPIFLDNNKKATEEMRRKSFSFRERAVLIPVEFVMALKPSLIVMMVLFLLGGLGGQGTFLSNMLNYGLFAVAGFLAAFLSGAVLTPLLLPWLPGRAFAIKGAIMGLLSAVILFMFRPGNFNSLPGRFELFGLLLIIMAVAAYLAMNFTGASTYTSLSGVRKEMRRAVPLEVAAVVIGLSLWLTSRLAF